MRSTSKRLPRFLVGMSRSGTTWLAKSLNEHPALACYGETQFWGKNFVPPNREGSYGEAEVERLREVLARNPLDSTVLKNGEDVAGRRGWMKHIRRDDLPALFDSALDELALPTAPAQAFVRIGEKIAEAEGKDAWIEKTSRHVNWSDRIVPGLPDARFLVTIREPYSFILSYKHQQDRGPDERRRGYARRYHPLGAALIWRTYLRSALRLAERYPEQVMLVRTHEMHSEPEAVLARAVAFLELEPCPSLSGIPRGDNSAFQGRERPELSAGEAFWVNLIASREIARGGFERREQGFPLLAVLGWTLALPLWGLRAFADISDRTEGSAIGYLWRWLFPPRG